MKKRFIILAVILIASFILTACGTEATEAPATEEPVVEEPEEPVVEEPEEPVVEEPEEPVVEEPEPTEEVVEPSASIRVWADEQRAPVLSDLAESFLAEYGVELVVENISSIRDQFSVAAPAGEGPDIIVLAHDQMPALAASGLIAPIDLGPKADEFVEEALKAFTYEGELYGMPYATENLGFFYNTDYVEEPPTTWEGVKEISQQLIDEGKVEYGMVLGGTSYDAYPWMTSQGGYIFGTDENGDYDPTDVGVGSEGMIKFGEMAKQWVDEGILSDNTDNTTAKSMFLNGEVAFFMNGPWELKNLREAEMPFAVAAFPDGGQPFMGVQGFLVNAFSDNILLAEAFLTEFVATQDTMLKFYEVDPRVPAYIPALEAMDDPDLQAIAEAGANAQPMPGIPEMGKVWGDWGNALGFIFTGDKTPEEAYTDAQNNIVAAIASDLSGMVNLPGNWQSTVSECSWAPDCAATAMELGDDGMYYATFTIPALADSGLEDDSYMVKVALDGAWTTNYGVDGVPDGDNYTFTLDEETEVTFVYDPETNLLEIITE